MIDYPDIAPSRPVWLMTLADLALLLVGFFVLLQATQQLDRNALARGLREGFDNRAPVKAPPVDAIPVAANGITDFAVGSAAVTGSTDALIRWVGEAGGDPRTTLTITGSVDGSSADVDPATNSGTILASDRARALAAAIAGGAPSHIGPTRIRIATTPIPGRRAAMVTLAFTGDVSNNDNRDLP
ncbi:MAG: flagellar motor protein MotB [Sphingomonas bacterium]|nr:flagellar motor protein MotB [Sphingomonas bacterium]